MISDLLCKLHKCLSKKKKDIQLIPEWDAFTHINGKGNYLQERKLSTERKRLKKGAKGCKTEENPQQRKTRKRISLVKDEVYPNITSNKEIPLSTQP